MALVVLLSNYLVLFPINGWLTWGAFVYPISFLVTELTNAFQGAVRARLTVYLGFGLGVPLSIGLANLQIAAASGSAFLASQLLDIAIFRRVRAAAWWAAPLAASLAASALDTALFWSIAFWGEEVPLLTWALGDFGVKVALDLAMLTPFRLLVRNGERRMGGAFLSFRPFVASATLRIGGGSHGGEGGDRELYPQRGGLSRAGLL